MIWPEVWPAGITNGLTVTPLKSVTATAVPPSVNCTDVALSEAEERLTVILNAPESSSRVSEATANWAGDVLAAPLWKAPTSLWPVVGRGTPRWSFAKMPVSGSAWPLPRAKLPGNRANVCVGPPLLASGARPTSGGLTPPTWLPFRVRESAAAASADQVVRGIDARAGDVVGSGAGAGAVEVAGHDNAVQCDPSRAEAPAASASPHAGPVTGEGAVVDDHRAAVNTAAVGGRIAGERAVVHRDRATVNGATVDGGIAGEGAVVHRDRATVDVCRRRWRELPENVQSLTVMFPPSMPPPSVAELPENVQSLTVMSPPSMPPPKVPELLEKVQSLTVMFPPLMPPASAPLPRVMVRPDNETVTPELHSAEQQSCSHRQWSRGLCPSRSG